MYAVFKTGGKQYRAAKGDKLKIEKLDAAEGDSVVIDLMSANREAPLFGEDAETFNPHRTVAARIPPFGLSFGIGIHTCFGRDIAGGLGNTKTEGEAPHLGTLTNLLKNLMQHDLGETSDVSLTSRRNSKLVGEMLDLD